MGTESNRNANMAAGLVGLAAGAAAMYYLDPKRGKRRRALVTDQVMHLSRKATDAVDIVARDMRNRVHGVAHDLQQRSKNYPVDDETLVARVRSRLGRLVSHPHSLMVASNDGSVTIGGPILSSEVSRLMRGIRAIPGVHEVIDQLTKYETSGTIPGLQGAGAATGQRFEFMQGNWSPSARFLGGMVGGALALNALMRRGPISVAAGLGGLAMLGRSATNLDLQRLAGIGSRRRGIDIHKSIEVAAPVDTVFRYWSNIENLPQIMTHLRSVRDLGHGRSKWTASGPAGIPVTWIAEIRNCRANHIISWRSQEGAIIRNAGTVTFEPVPDNHDRTRIHVSMTYKPPTGLIAHAISCLFGVDPKHALDEDLLRLKSTLEHGKRKDGHHPGNGHTGLKHRMTAVKSDDAILGM